MIFKMIRLYRVPSTKVNYRNISKNYPKQSFITNEYKCTETWKSHATIQNEINLNNFYNLIDQKYSTKGVISAIDVDIFANSVNDPTHLDELRDLLHKLRLSAEAGNILESTHQATVRNYLQFGTTEELISILKEPLAFGIFLDDYTATILLDRLLSSSDSEQAAIVASLVMLQESYDNEITSALCQYACYKYIIGHTKTTEPEVVVDKKTKIEEIKIRIKFLRNPYYDDHFDIKDTYVSSGKTLAWMSQKEDNLNINLQIIGWLAYQKHDKVVDMCQKYISQAQFRIYSEIIQIFDKEIALVDESIKKMLEDCKAQLKNVATTEMSLEDSIKINIENAINKNHKSDIKRQNELFQLWAAERKTKLDEQTQRLDRAKRIELITQKHIELQQEEQKLWFFDNEDNIDLQIEDKNQLSDNSKTRKKTTKKIDDDYIPPEILPKRR